MKEELREEIQKLTQIIGVSGYEWNVAKAIASEVKVYADDIKLCHNGNLIIKIKGEKAGPKVLCGAHMDQVGYVVKSIDDQGFIYFGKVGGSSENILPSRKVMIETSKGNVTGVIGARSTHMVSDQEKMHMQSVKESYVDIGANSRAQAEEWGVVTGCQMVIDSPCTEMRNKDFLLTKAADCRALCAVLVGAIKRIRKEEISGELYFVFTVMEEVSMTGIRSATEDIQPDYCYILDTVPAGDVPDIFSTDNTICLNKGPVLILAQQNERNHNYAIAHPKMLETVRNVARECKIPVQEFAFVGAHFSNDGAVAIGAGSGPAVFSIALPRRYSHSPTELISLNDCVDIEQLLLALMKTEIDFHSFETEILG